MQHVSCWFERAKHSDRNNDCIKSVDRQVSLGNSKSGVGRDFETLKMRHALCKLPKLNEGMTYQHNRSLRSQRWFSTCHVPGMVVYHVPCSLGMVGCHVTWNEWCAVSPGMVVCHVKWNGVGLYVMAVVAIVYHGMVREQSPTQLIVCKTCFRIFLGAFHAF